MRTVRARRVLEYVGRSVGLGRFKGQCAALVQWFGCGKTRYWREGIRVKGNGVHIRRYTCIATFENGLYPSRPHGNHAAVYVSQDEGGINVYDQWTGKPVGQRYIPFSKDDSREDPSNNGNCFSVILTTAPKGG